MFVDIIQIQNTSILTKYPWNILNKCGLLKIYQDFIYQYWSFACEYIDSVARVRSDLWRIQNIRNRPISKSRNVTQFSFINFNIHLFK